MLVLEAIGLHTLPDREGRVFAGTGGRDVLLFCEAFLFPRDIPATKLRL